MEHAFELIGLTKTFGDQRAVDESQSDRPQGIVLRDAGAERRRQDDVVVDGGRAAAARCRYGEDLRSRRRQAEGEGAGRRTAGRCRDAGAADRSGGADVSRPAARPARGRGRGAYGGAPRGARARPRGRQAGDRLLDRDAEEARARGRVAARAAAARARRAVRGGRPGLGGDDPDHPEQVHRRWRLGGDVESRDGAGRAAVRPRGRRRRREGSCCRHRFRGAGRRQPGGRVRGAGRSVHRGAEGLSWLSA